MKLIIDIDEDYYKAIWENGYIYDEDNEDIAKIIKYGTPLEEEFKNKNTGYWIENAPEWQNVDPPYICSECGNFHLRKTNYCDQCGAKMKGE